ncbi:STAS domain protein [Rubripirellula obstinata]|uniref:STAS domain protein n=1 Tax=Rubripirellula obstinata TaxID=406547 RepID=A0A5B1CB77_9BACT|nr:STAS domain-containing protein [Rubripirellula obstinata]KAA1258418.1 STAS domain protein [Rubripirellula obstinata]
MSQVEVMRVSRKGSDTVVSFSSDHLNQFDSARRIFHDFSELIENGLCRSHPIDHINVDFGRIDRISSVGLNGLIQMNSKSRNHGVRLVLTDVPKAVFEVFQLTRMERMFEFASTTSNPVSSV